MRNWIIAAAGVSLALLATPAGQANAQPASPTAPPAAPGAPTAPVAAPAAAAPRPLSETLTGEAKADYEGGKILFQARDFAAALVKFEHAYALTKDPRLLWNAAICQKELRRYARMLSTIERYLKDGGTLLTDRDRENAAEIVKTVQKFVSPLKLTANEDGASVVVDGETIGTTPLQRGVLLDVGMRTIRVQKPGFKEVARTVTVVGVGEIALSVTLRRELHRGTLTVTAAPRDYITIDGKMAAQGRYEGSLPSGGHTLLVEAKGMASYQTEVVIQDNQPRSILVSLNPLPEPTDSSKWLWLVGGAVLLGGAITAGAVLYHPNEGVPGTINTTPIQLHFDFGGKR